MSQLVVTASGKGTNSEIKLNASPQNRLQIIARPTVNNHDFLYRNNLIVNAKCWLDVAKLIITSTDSMCVLQNWYRTASKLEATEKYLGSLFINNLIFYYCM